MKLHFRLWATFSLVFILLGAVMAVFIINFYKARMFGAQATLGVTQGASVVERMQGTLPRYPERAAGYVQYYARTLDVRFIALDEDKRVKLDSFQQVREGTKLSLAILLEESELPATKFVSTKEYGHVQYTLLRISEEEVFQGYLLMLKDVNELYADFRDFSIRVALMVLGAVVIFFFISYQIASRFTQPIRRILRGMKQISPGYRSFQVHYRYRDEIKELIIGIHEMVNQLNGFDERQRQFMSSSSHELKTPIATMQLINENLPFVRGNPDQHQEFVEDMAVQLTRMKHIVERMMDVYRMWDKPLERSWLDNEKLREHVKDHFLRLAEANGVTLQFELQDELYVDHEMFLRALDNVVSNAIRYSPDGGTVTIRVQRNKDGIRECIVTDEGIGIAAQDIPYLFEPFYRAAQAMEVEQGGSGLGLTIVKQMMHIHNGEVRVESKPGQGTRVVMAFRHARPSLSGNNFVTK